MNVAAGSRPFENVVVAPTGSEDIEVALSDGEPLIEVFAGVAGDGMLAGRNWNVVIGTTPLSSLNSTLDAMIAKTSSYGSADNGLEIVLVESAPAFSGAHQNELLTCPNCKSDVRFKSLLNEPSYCQRGRQIAE